jgi:hypothetical protein
MVSISAIGVQCYQLEGSIQLSHQSKENFVHLLLSGAVNLAIRFEMTIECALIVHTQGTFNVVLSQHRVWQKNLDQAPKKGYRASSSIINGFRIALNQIF